MFDTTCIPFFCFHVMNIVSKCKVHFLSRYRITNGYFHLPFSSPCPVSIETNASLVLSLTHLPDAIAPQAIQDIKNIYL